MPDGNDYLDTLFKDAYKAELDKAEKLDAQINLPTAIVTVFCGIAALYFDRLPALQLVFGTMIFYLLMCCYIASLIRTIYFMIRSYAGFEYALTPSLQEIDGRVQQLRIYYLPYFEGDSSGLEDEIKRIIQSEMQHYYQEAATANRATNRNRTSWMYFTTRWIVVSLVLLVMSRLAFYSIDKPSPQKTEFTDSTRLKVEVVTPQKQGGN